MQASKKSLSPSVSYTHLNGGIDLRFLRVELRIGINLLLFVICKPCLIVLFGLCQFLFGSVELLLVIVQLFLPVTDLFLAVRELFFRVRELLFGVIELILRLGQLIVGFGDDLVISAACAGFQSCLLYTSSWPSKRWPLPQIISPASTNTGTNLRNALKPFISFSPLSLIRIIISQTQYIARSVPRIDKKNQTLKSQPCIQNDINRSSILTH